MQNSKFRKIGIFTVLAVAISLIIYTVQAPADCTAATPPPPPNAATSENAVLATGLLEGIKQVQTSAPKSPAS